MFTHIWSPKARAYMPLQGAQSKRLNTILVNPKMVSEVLGPFSPDNPRNILDGDSLKGIYKLGPLMFPTIERAHASCARMVCDLIRIQSLTKLARIWPCVLSLGSGDSQTFYDLVKRRKYLDAFRLLMSYAYVPGVSAPNQIGLPTGPGEERVLEDRARGAEYGELKAYKQGFIDVLTGVTDAPNIRI